MSSQGLSGPDRWGGCSETIRRRVRSCRSRGWCLSAVLAARHARCRILGDDTGGPDVANRTSANNELLRVASFNARVAAILFLITVIAMPAPVRGEDDPKIAPDFAVSVLPGILTVNEGGSAKFSVGLSNRPAAYVRVAISIDPEARDRFTVDDALLEFSPDTHHLRQLVRVWALHDDDAIDESVQIVFTGLGDAYDGTVSTVNTISVRDDDAAAVLVEPSALTIDEDGSERLSVMLGRGLGMGGVQSRHRPRPRPRVGAEGAALGLRVRRREFER